MRKLFYAYLALLAKLSLRRYKPLVIAVTGSVGKTTTKDMIAAVLQQRYRVRASERSYNNELGLPLTILGAPSASSSALGWLGIVAKATVQVFGYQRGYPQVLVLEMGADHPGDLAYLTSIAKPDIAVLTAIAPVHLEFFKNIEEVAREKRSIFKSLKPNGTAILNEDDNVVSATKVDANMRTLRYGMSDNAGIKGSDVNMRFSLGQGSEEAKGEVNFKISHEGSSVPVHLDGVLGEPAVLSALAASSVALSLGMNLVDISDVLSATYKGTPGRLRLLPGIKGTTVIDDSYNASPAAMIAAINVLVAVPKDKKNMRWAVLGSMAELGTETAHGHELVGAELAKQRIDGLVTVGERARMIAQTVREKGMDARNIFSFAKAEEAGHFLQERLEPGDVVLIKGSQVVRMEKVVKEIMAEPSRASELLVRQGPEWQGR
ncbi:MAG: UDP-N-acetylmuramoyl-tripeptide--D-alanyl-D-alanine ligase [Patescibacteria group bacterium]|jgi:UDP-N-acetylmuramoyl-tripeptide--D-alanyl-D-alanine ligase